MLCISTDTKSVFVCFTGVQAWQKWEKWLRFVCLRLCKLVPNRKRKISFVRYCNASSSCTLSNTSSPICSSCSSSSSSSSSQRCTEPACVFWMSKPVALSSWSNLCMLCCLQCGHSCATSWHRNGPAGLRRLPHLAHVHPWSNERAVFLLPYSQSSPGGKSSGTRQLWELQDAADVPIWSTVCEMCCLQFCHTCWGLIKR